MLGILGAMREEVESVIAELQSRTTKTRGKREFHQGTFDDVPVVVVYSRIGKVAAASTATTLVSEFDVDRVLFTGVAGSADFRVKVGDVVVGTHLYQHDMDASPLYPQHQIPLLDTDRFHTDPELCRKVVDAARRFAGYRRVWEGAIASGDKFFASKVEVAVVKSRLPDIMCVEMEGAAVAQVCYEHQVPFAIFRTISDGADGAAPLDFQEFIRAYAQRYAVGIVKNLVAPFV